MRKISLNLYFSAFIVSLIIFMLGIYAGIKIEQKTQDLLMQELLGIEQRTANLELLFTLDDSKDFCPVFEDELNSVDEKTMLLGKELEYNEEVKKVKDVELKRRYFVLEAESYLLALKIKKMCDANYSLILFFYKPDCPECIDLGNTLTKVKEEKKDLARIYSFDVSLESKVVEALLRKYGVVSAPSLVIDETGFSNLKKKEEIINEMK